MANLSTAHGNATITTRTKDILSKLLYLHVRSEESIDYDTTFSDIYNLNFDEIKNYVNENAITSTTESEYVSINLDFTGTGRWNFSSNVSWFFDYLKTNDAPYYINQLVEKDPNFKEIIKQLNQERLIVDFNIHDSESGHNFISVYSQKVTWNPATQKQTTFEPEDYNSDDYNAENLIHYGFDSKGEVWDVEYIRENFDEFIDYLKEETDTSSDFLIIRQNILNNMDAFKNFIHKSDFNNYGVYYEINDILFDVLQLTPESKFE